MATYQELVKKYSKRKHDALIDTVTTSLSYADNVAVDLGLLDDTGVLGDALNTVGGALPFAVIAVTEQMKVIMGRKTGKAGVGDALSRMLKTGAAMGVGALAGMAGGTMAAIPAAIGTRTLLDKYKSNSLLCVRLHSRIDRLKALQQQLDRRNPQTLLADMKKDVQPLP